MADLAVTLRAYEAGFQDPGDIGFYRMEVMAIAEDFSSRLVLDREIGSWIGSPYNVEFGNFFHPVSVFYAAEEALVLYVYPMVVVNVDTDAGTHTVQRIAADEVAGYYISNYLAMIPGSDGCTYLFMTGETDPGAVPVWMIFRALPGDNFTFLRAVLETIPSSPEVYLNHLFLAFVSTSGVSNYLHFGAPVLDIVDGVMTLPASETGGDELCRAVDVVLDTGAAELRGFAPPIDYLMDVWGRYTPGLSYYDPTDGPSAGPVYDLDGFDISPLTDNLSPASFAPPLGTGPTAGYMRADGASAHFMYDATTRLYTSIPDSAFGETKCIKAVAGGKYLKFAYSAGDLTAKVYGYATAADLAADTGSVESMEKPFGVVEDVDSLGSRANYSFRIVGATTAGAAPAPVSLSRFWTGYRNTNEISEAT